jgi:ER membrane protein complex subunit 4
MAVRAQKSWKFELSSVPSRITKQKSLPKPPGFDADNVEPDTEQSAVSIADKEMAAKQRQMMGVAYGPGKGLLTTGFMLWMSGNSIQIFSIMMTGMALINPLKAITTVNATFSRFEGVDTKMAKLIFVALQLLSFGVALYKLSVMGLLPTTSVDWLQNLPEQRFLEHSSTPL